MRNMIKAIRKFTRNTRRNSKYAGQSIIKIAHEHKYMVSAVVGTFTIAVLTVSMVSARDIATVTVADTSRIASELKTEKTYESIKLSDTSVAELGKSVASARQVQLEAYKITSDDKLVAYVRNRKIADNALSSLKDEYAVEGVSIENTKFKENVIIEKVSLDVIDAVFCENKAELLSIIKEGTEEQKVHVVQSGDTVSGIAQRYGISSYDIVKANPEIDIDKLKLNQELNLVAPTQLITVQTLEKVTYSVPIDYETVYQDSANIYKGDTKIQTTGIKGSKEVVATIVKENGIEVEREIHSEVIVKLPSDQVVLKGTKTRPPTVGSGVLARPSRGGRLSSKFGYRWGSFHKGIDLAMPSGSTVTSADGGTVIESSYSGSYGNLIVIDHQNGMVTKYAHLSVRGVKVGDKVYKGQVIGKSGNTGRSTGPHLHFEVLINGTNVNPLKYVNY